MAKRLTRIITRTGDDGTTGLADGSRTAKDSPRIEALGAVDELNSSLGLLLVHDLPAALRALLEQVQHRLFDLGGELALSGHRVMDEAQIGELEAAVSALNADLPPLEEFILPGGGPAAAACHMARAVCRRAERRLLGLAAVGQVNGPSRVYLNRLSDLLFVAARVLARTAGEPETQWRQARKDD